MRLRDNGVNERHFKQAGYNMTCVNLQTPRQKKVRLSLHHFETTYRVILKGISGKARSVWGGHTTRVRLHEPVGNIQLEYCSFVDPGSLVGLGDVSDLA